jgi:hypothetical protein
MPSIGKKISYYYERLLNRIAEFHLFSQFYDAIPRIFLLIAPVPVTALVETVQISSNKYGPLPSGIKNMVNF